MKMYILQSYRIVKPAANLQPSYITIYIHVFWIDVYLVYIVSKLLYRKFMFI